MLQIRSTNRLGGVEREKRAESREDETGRMAPRAHIYLMNSGGNHRKRTTSRTSFVHTRAGEAEALNMAEDDDWWGEAGELL